MSSTDSPTTTTETAPVAPQVTAAPTAPQLQLKDLASVIEVIDVCSKRGAFEGSELSMIGQLRDRIAAFLQAANPAPAPAPATPDSAVTEVK